MGILKISHKSDIDYVLEIQSDNRGKSVKLLHDHCYDYFIRTMMKQNSLSKFDSDDYFQEAFILVWSQITTKNIFIKDGELYRWKIDGHQNNVILQKFTRDIRSYLVDVGMNFYRTAMRQNKEEDIEDLPQGWDKNLTTEDVDNKDKYYMAITESLNKMPRGCRTLLRMFIYEKLSNEDVLKRLHGRYNNSDSLKTGKNKCMSKLKEKANAMYLKFNQ